jgi:hypothetical protein
LYVLMRYFWNIRFEFNLRNRLDPHFSVHTALTAS